MATRSPGLQRRPRSAGTRPGGSPGRRSSAQVTSAVAAHHRVTVGDDGGDAVPHRGEVPVRHVCDATAGRSAGSQADRGMIRGSRRPIEGSAVQRGPQLEGAVRGSAWATWPSSSRWRSCRCSRPELAAPPPTPAPTPIGGRPATRRRGPRSPTRSASAWPSRASRLPTRGADGAEPALTREQRRQLRQARPRRAASARRRVRRGRGLAARTGSPTRSGSASPTRASRCPARPADGTRTAVTCRAARRAAPGGGGVRPAQRRPPRRRRRPI